jgi:hypothetical protein
MCFSGKNLQRLRDAVARAIANVHYEIGSHPAPCEYEDELQELENEQARYERLLDRLDSAIEKERFP